MQLWRDCAQKRCTDTNPSSGLYWGPWSCTMLHAAPQAFFWLLKQIPFQWLDNQWVSGLNCQKLTLDIELRAFSVTKNMPKTFCIPGMCFLLKVLYRFPLNACSKDSAEKAKGFCLRISILSTFTASNRWLHDGFIALKYRQTTARCYGQALLGFLLVKTKVKARLLNVDSHSLIH